MRIARVLTLLIMSAILVALLHTQAGPHVRPVDASALSTVKAINHSKFRSRTMSPAVRVHIQHIPNTLHMPPPRQKANRNRKEGFVAARVQNAQRVGKTILEEGAVPTLVGRFIVPFRKYLRLVEQVGAKFVVLDRESGEIIGGIRNGRFVPSVSLQDLSGVGRDVTMDIGHHDREHDLEEVVKARGPGAYRFLVLFPKVIEQRFIGTIGGLLHKHGIDIALANAVYFSYRTNNGALYITVDEVVVRGKSHKFHLIARFL